MLEIRYHHLNCMKHFVGKGYSEEFTNNMQDVIDRIKDGEEYKLVTHRDDICKACPNKKFGICRSEIVVKIYDKKTKRLGEGHEKEICSHCQWSEICLQK